MSELNECPFCGLSWARQLDGGLSFLHPGSDIACPLVGYTFTDLQWAMRPLPPQVYVEKISETLDPATLTLGETKLIVEYVIKYLQFKGYSPSEDDYDYEDEDE